MRPLTVLDAHRITGRSRGRIYRAVERGHLPADLTREAAIRWSASLEGPMNESALQAKVITLCHDLGLLVFHSTDSRRDVGRGFPDLVIVGKAGGMFAEVKDNWGQLSPDQCQWKYSLMASGAQWRLWRPSDWQAIEAELRGIA